MTSVDLNADLAEGDAVTRQDLGVLDEVSSASLACGFHAGCPEVMRSTAAACVARGVSIGAHVSYRDPAGFGRRTVDVEQGHLVEGLVEQFRTLAAEVDGAGGAVSFVKPHGALYHQMGVHTGTADAVVESLGRMGISALVCQAGTVVARRAAEAGLRVVAEGFPDRGYLPDGRLAPRGSPGGMVEDPEEAGRRAVAMVRRGGVESVDGSWVDLRVDTLCIHGDAPGADLAARSVRRSLEADGIAVAAWGGAPGGAPRVG
jgi:UPF0271 protein